jgi:chemotaxis protein methyltransferase CheR
VRFLQWSLPQIGLRWSGFRRVRRTVCKRLARRLRELDLADLDAYRAVLLQSPEEWTRLDGMCRIPISRFARDRAVFEALADDLLPALASNARAVGRRRLTAWSAGCASGEEPYSLAIVWRLAVAPSVPDVALTILATDIDATMLARARRACYGPGSLRELRPEWRVEAFEMRDGEECLDDRFRRDVTLRPGDLRVEMPRGPFDVILCRNLAFTYFDPQLARRTLQGLHRRLRPGALLIVGAHEQLPDLTDAPFERIGPALPIYRTVSGVRPAGQGTPDRPEAVPDDG